MKKYYIKRLGFQELGSVTNGRTQRGRYIYISKDERVLDFFPQLSKTVTNDSSIIPIIPLYQKHINKVYCNYIYHNDKFNVDGGTRNEYRIYSNNALEGNVLLFQQGDILIFRAEKASALQDDLTVNDILERAVEDSKVYFLYRCFEHDSELYRQCSTILENSGIRGGHAIFEGAIDELEGRIKDLCKDDLSNIDAVIDESVTAKVQTGNIEAMASLFNSVSFRDFVMTGYNYRCAITRNVIRYGQFMNLEAAHIRPRSHQGLYLPCNGIALCRDMHWAFDKGMFTIDDNLRIIVHPDIKSDYLRQFHNKQLFVPENSFFRPDINNLRYHRTNVYGLFKTSGSLVNANGYNAYAAPALRSVAEEAAKYCE